MNIFFFQWWNSNYQLWRRTKLCCSIDSIHEWCIQLSKPNRRIYWDVMTSNNKSWIYKIWFFFHKKECWYWHCVFFFIKINRLIKGQLISKCPFGIIVWTKYQRNYFWISALSFFVASWGLHGSSLGFLGT